MCQNFDIHRFLRLVLLGALIVLAQCAGALNQGGGDGDGSAAEGSEALFTGGPVDIPVTIAKLEAPDPSNITVDVSGGGSNLGFRRATSGTITLTGEPRALTTTQVYIYSSETGETQITDVESDGSFDATTLQGTGPLMVAGYDGTNIGTPIFLKVSEGKYVWYLTNGDEILASVLAEEDGTTVVAVNGSSGSSALRKQSGEEATTDVYTLDIAGVDELKGNVPCTVDEIFTRGGDIVARCDNDFYLYTEDSGSFEESFSIDSSETISFTDVERDEDNELYTVVGTDAGTSIGKMSNGQVTEIDTLTAGCEEYTLVKLFIYEGSGQYDGDLMAIVESRNTCTTPVQNRHQLLSLTGEVISITLTDSYGAETTYQATVSNESTGASLTLTKILFEEGDTQSYYQYYEPNTLSSCTAGSDTLDVYSIWSMGMGGSVPYILDGSLTLQQGSGQTFESYGYTICDATRTRSVYHVELHSSGKIACFCADDDDGNGQLYAYCPSEVEFMQDPDGSEIRQITTGVEHCNEVKNWKCDDSIVIVGTHDDFTEVQIVIPEEDPDLEDCF